MMMLGCIHMMLHKIILRKLYKGLTHQALNIPLAHAYDATLYMPCAGVTGGDVGVIRPTRSAWRLYYGGDP